MCPRWVSFIFIVCADSGALLGPDAANAQANYLVPLGTIEVGTPRGLNNNDQVLVSTGLFSNGVFTLFPGGFTGLAINAQGDVAGMTAAGHLALYKGGTVADLGGQPVSLVTGINASAQIVGATYNSSGLTGFIYGAGVMTAIDGPSVSGATGSSIAEGINDSGEVTGAAYTHNGQNEAYTWANAVLTDLGPGGGDAINASGEVTGAMYRSGDSYPHAYIYGRGGMKVLAEPPPFIGSEGFSINRSGEIVGILQGAASSSPFFFNGVMTDINLLVAASDPLKPTVTLDSDIAINDNRLMFLTGHDSNLGGSQLYLLQAPWLDVAPGPLTFAGQPAGTTSAPQLVTLTNSGTVPLPLDSISSASSAPEFQQTNACPSALAPGANCTASVTYSPTVAGDGTSKLDVVTNGATIEIPLSGTSPIAITLSANPTQPLPGKAFTITWNATTGSSCQSSGGAPGDGWTATTPSGSVSVTEATAATYVYQLACSAGSQSQVAKLSVTVGSPPAGGGGAVDVWALLTLSGLLGLRRGSQTLRSERQS